MLQLSDYPQGDPQSLEREHMKATESAQQGAALEYDELVERVEYDFGLNRRAFVHFLGAGILLAVSASSAVAQSRGGRGGGARVRNIAARVHIAKDGSITVMTGKVEAGQGARAELTLAAAEELRVPASAVQLIMADTSLVPDDGITAGSGSTPRTVPSIRQGAAAARELLVDFASKQWGVDRNTVEVRNGVAFNEASGRKLGYADLAASAEGEKAFAQAVPEEVTLTLVSDWKVMGVATPRPNGRDIVTGAHSYPSDTTRPGMWYGKVLRPASFGAKLISIDLSPAKQMKDVVVVQDDQFVGVAAPSTVRASEALAAIRKTAKWEPASHPSSDELFDYLKQHAHEIPANPFAEQLSSANKTFRQTFRVAYAQHAPMEPRSAVAEWNDGKLIVWAGTQNPFGYRGELARAFHLAEDRVRVVVPDFGGAFGGKHTAEAAVEAARLAQGASRPVSLRWTREEEFTWAYFRPAAVIDVEASLDSHGALTSWHFININSGGAGVETPYRTGQKNCRYVGSDAPLRQGSYRALAATANHFARESFMDELASAAGSDPLAFRLAHLENARLRAVLETAAQRFGWSDGYQKKSETSGVGLACGTEKGSYVATCAEIAIEEERIAVRRVCEVFECGAVVNPSNLKAQVQGAIIMGLGPALREGMKFENGRMLNASFRSYEVPRFSDVPELDIHLLNRTDLPPAGAGETPIIGIAPAIANAVFHATGKRVRQMPIRLS